MSNHTVDKEVDTGVEDSGEVRNMGETFNPFLREEGELTLAFQEQFIAVDYIFKVVELPNVNDCSWCVTAYEDDHNAEKHHEHVDLLPKFSL